MREVDTRPQYGGAEGDDHATPPLRARVEVTLKAGIRDPQGHAVEGAIASLGYRGIRGVRFGKHITFEIDGPRPDAERRVLELCEKLLANPVVENYVFELDDVTDAQPPAGRTDGQPEGRP